MKHAYGGTAGLVPTTAGNADGADKGERWPRAVTVDLAQGLGKMLSPTTSSAAKLRLGNRLRRAGDEWGRTTANTIAGGGGDGSNGLAGARPGMPRRRS